MNNKAANNIIVYSVTGILVISLIVASVSVFPLYSRLKENRENNLSHAATIRTMAVEEYVTRVQEIARQVASRTQIRKKLEAYNRGEVSRNELIAFTKDKLSDAMSASEEAVGITRISSDGTPLVVVGMPLPEGASLPVPPDESRAVVIGAPFRVGGVPFLVAGVHIYGEGPKRAGTDIVIFKMDHVQSIVRDYSGLGKTAEIILGAGEAGRIRPVFPLKHDGAPVPAFLPEGSFLGELIKAAIGKESGISIAKDDDGKAVIVAYRPIQGVLWGILVKMDSSEYFAPLNRQMFILGGVIVLLIILAAFGTVFLLKPLTSALDRELLDRKRTEEALQVKEDQFRTIVNHAPVVLWSLDAEGRFTVSEGKALALLGLKPGEVVGHSVYEAYRDIPQVIGDIRRAFAGDEFSSIVRVGELYFETHYEPLLDAEGRVTGISGISNDITESQKARDRIEKQLERLSTLRTIDKAITASLDINHTLDVFIEQVMIRLGVDAAQVLLMNPYTKYLEHAAGSGFTTDTVKGLRFRLGDGYAGQAALSHENIIVPEIDLSHEMVSVVPGFKALLEANGFRAYFAVPLIAKGAAVGCLELFHRSPLNPDREWLTFLEALAGQAAIAIDNARMFNEIRNARDEIVLAYDSTIEGWANALDLRDSETEGHSQRVAEMTVRIAREMGMTEEELVHVRRGSLLHDIGKMSIHDSVLFKEGPLTDEERERMHHHPENAFNLLYPIKYLRPALDIPYCHHERWDGTGYPRGLKGEQIPLSARIFTIVDTWDALLTSRRYREAWSPEKVRDHIQSLAGTHFDPRIVDVFLKMVSP
jgi:PAS domain S-box-containing protein/putative nucleotidyltransferase with HDIG domain